MGKESVHNSAEGEILLLTDEVYRQYLALSEENKKIVIRQIEILIDLQSTDR